MSAEATVVRNYIDWLVKVPWKKRTKGAPGSPGRGKTVLEEDHYGLEEGQRTHSRIPFAVQATREGTEGPDSVPRGFRPASAKGRRSGRALRRATNRKFVRMSLGGVARRGGDSWPSPHLHRLDAGQDRSEPRQGEGSQSAVPASTKSTRCRWTSAAIRRPRLLEVLDPEQKRHVQRSLPSRSTSISLRGHVSCAPRTGLNIPAPLLDRMEVIRLPGYTEDEKLNIARRYLVPKQIAPERSERKTSSRFPIRRFSTSSATTRVKRAFVILSSARGSRNIGRKVVKQLASEATQGHRAGRPRQFVEVDRRATLPLWAAPRRTIRSARSRGWRGPRVGWRVAHDRSSNRAGQRQADPQPVSSATSCRSRFRPR